jgi:hypothetical protein
MPKGTGDRFADSGQHTANENSPPLTTTGSFGGYERGSTHVFLEALIEESSLIGK